MCTALSGWFVQGSRFLWFAVALGLSTLSTTAHSEKVDPTCPFRTVEQGRQCLKTKAAKAKRDHVISRRSSLTVAASNQAVDQTLQTAIRFQLRFSRARHLIPARAANRNTSLHPFHACRPAPEGLIPQWCTFSRTRRHNC